MSGRLRRSDCATPGITRVRSGRGFTYRWPDGTRVDDAEHLDRIASLVIPPAWTDVWICPTANGHLQAVGTDAAGRRQYRYHPRWVERRRQDKHERVLALAERLPDARRRSSADLARRGMPREKALAVAFRLLEHGFFRVGSERYALEHGTVGLATMRRDQVVVCGASVSFHYLGKGGIERSHRIVDAEIARPVRLLATRADDGKHAELLAWRDRNGWHDVRSHDINDYVREVTGGEFTAKDFRTWGATVLMAQALAVSQALPVSATARRRAVARAVTEVAGYLGNTPAVARRSYIDPRVVDLYLDGVAVDVAVVDDSARTPGLAIHGPMERAVVRMLQDPRQLSRAA